ATFAYFVYIRHSAIVTPPPPPAQIEPAKPAPPPKVAEKVPEVTPAEPPKAAVRVVPETSDVTSKKQEPVVTVNVCPGLPGGPYLTMPPGYQAQGGGCVPIPSSKPVPWFDVSGFLDSIPFFDPTDEFWRNFMVDAFLIIAAIGFSMAWWKGIPGTALKKILVL